jgi:hypothetical protein
MNPQPGNEVTKTLDFVAFHGPEIKYELCRRRDRDRDRRDGGRPGHGGGGVRRRDRREPGPPSGAGVEADPQREVEEEQRKPIILAKSER